MKRIVALGIVLTLLFVGMLTLAFNIQKVKASGTIHIRANGSINPPTANITSLDNITYYFTGNNYDEVVVERSNIIIDGDGYTLQGSGRGYGVYLSGINNMTIKNMKIKAFRHGIYLDMSSDNSISGNNITANNDMGIYLYEASNNSLSGNVMNSNKYNLGVRGSELSSFLHSINDSNFVDGKPVYYLVNHKNLVINSVTHPQVGYLALINCTNVTVEGLTLTNNVQGLLLAYTNNSRITDNNIINNKFAVCLNYSATNDILRNNITNNYYGIGLNRSSSNKISRNNITNNYYGICLEDSSNNNTIYGNNITENINPGIMLWYSSNNNTVSRNNIANINYGIDITFSSSNNISQNNVTGNGWGIVMYYGSSNNSIYGNNITNNRYYGIQLHESSYNSICRNNITNNRGGILLSHSLNNSISGNKIINNDHGVWLWRWSSNNKFYHNNFIGNTQKVSSQDSINTWDDGYPSGGNYWSDYAGVDVKSGPNQDQPSSDGIGDTAYVIDANNTDHYPLMYPWGAPPPSSYTLTIHSSPTGVTFTVDGVSRTTLWSGTYSEGSSVSLVMPETHNVLANYIWSHWREDGDTNRIKTVTMDTNITLTAVYTRPTPVGGEATPINIPINKPELQIPWIWLSTIILAIAVTVVFFKHRKKQ